MLLSVIDVHCIKILATTQIAQLKMSNCINASLKKWLPVANFDCSDGPNSFSDQLQMSVSILVIIARLLDLESLIFVAHQQDRHFADLGCDHLVDWYKNECAAQTSKRGKSNFAIEKIHGYCECQRHTPENVWCLKRLMIISTLPKGMKWCDKRHDTINIRRNKVDKLASRNGAQLMLWKCEQTIVQRYHSGTSNFDGYLKMRHIHRIQQAVQDVPCSCKSWS